MLIKELGPEWRSMFSEFDPKPFAAASIGQVHCAKLLDGTEVALKIQVSFLSLSPLLFSSSILIFYLDYFLHHI